MNYVDLHCHSSCSDGTYSPEELIDKALQVNLKGLSLTDHDTIAGLKNFLNYGKKQGIEVIAGIELSANLNEQPLHILGYGFDYNNLEFLSILQSIQKSREIRNKKIVAKLQDINISITYDKLKKLAGKGQIGRPHFATLLVQQHKVPNFQQAFDLYLRKDRPAYAARQILRAKDAINAICLAGGVAILAHPGTLQLPWEQLMATFHTLQDIGLSGIECYYPTHSEKFRKKLQAHCLHHNLLMTGGSDYHGDIRPGTRLGNIQKKQRTPLNVLRKLKKYLEQN